jgi:hypothetical protein
MPLLPPISLDFLDIKRAKSLADLAPLAGEFTRDVEAANARPQAVLRVERAYVEFIGPDVAFSVQLSRSALNGRKAMGANPTRRLRSEPIFVAFLIPPFSLSTPFNQISSTLLTMHTTGALLRRGFSASRRSGRDLHPKAIEPVIWRERGMKDPAMQVFFCEPAASTCRAVIFDATVSEIQFERVLARDIITRIRNYLARVTDEEAAILAPYLVDYLLFSRVPWERFDQAVARATGDSSIESPDFYQRLAKSDEIQRLVETYQRLKPDGFFEAMNKVLHTIVRRAPKPGGRLYTLYSASEATVYRRFRAAKGPQEARAWPREARRAKVEMYQARRAELLSIACQTAFLGSSPHRRSWGRGVCGPYPGMLTAELRRLEREAQPKRWP